MGYEKDDNVIQFKHPNTPPPPHTSTRTHPPPHTHTPPSGDEFESLADDDEDDEEEEDDEAVGEHDHFVPAGFKLPAGMALPAGLDTVVGSGGRKLTDAQAQQVALARLVLADPHTLVLDEATSLLDPRAARHLERSLSAVLAGRTVVAIAHRLHTAHDADRVAVVDSGRIAEIGRHDELVAAGGEYAALWRSWQHESA